MKTLEEITFTHRGRHTDHYNAREFVDKIKAGGGFVNIPMMRSLADQLNREWGTHYVVDDGYSRVADPKKVKVVRDITVTSGILGLASAKTPREAFLQWADDIEALGAKPATEKTTTLSYMYRDASNYKACHEVVFPGEITEEEKEKILTHLDQGEWFIPSQVGLPDLQGRLVNFPDQQDDHVWHEIEPDDFEVGSKPPTESIDIHEFVKKFCETEWDPVKKSAELGLFGWVGSDLESNGPSM